MNATRTVRMNLPPTITGPLTATPVRGTERKTNFRLTAPSAADVDAPVRYSFFYVRPSSGSQVRTDPHRLFAEGAVTRLLTQPRGSTGLPGHEL